ncbi:ATPase [Bacteroidia bacterium]|nr:ATPase [Bacteroidia bacterium]
MSGKYTEYLQHFKHRLNRFRWELLLYDVCKAGNYLILFAVHYLVAYKLMLSAMTKLSTNLSINLSVPFKATLYALFIIGILTILSYHIIRNLFRFFRSLNLDNKLLLKRIYGFPDIVNDLFSSLYYLSLYKEKIAGDAELKKAAFVQKYETLQSEQMLLRFPRKLLLRKVLSFALFLVIFLFSTPYFSGVFANLSNYEDVSNPHLNIHFHLLNESLDIENGKPFQLRLKVESEATIVENVFIAFGGGEFLMSKADSIFVYDFDVLNNDLKFNFIANNTISQLYKLRVLPSPEITAYQVTSTPPAYTGSKSEVFTNTVDFRVLHGSSLRFSVNFSNVDTLFLKNSKGTMPVTLKSKSSADFIQKVRESEEMTLMASNAHFVRKELIHFSVASIPDLYPTIQVSSIQDSVDKAQYYFYGLISDDYGFTGLRFAFSLNGRNNTVIPINISKNLTTQEFYFEFNFGEFAGMDKTDISYYFEVFDNDDISGPKSSRTDVSNYRIPDLNTIFEQNEIANTNINAALKESEKLAKDIISSLKGLQLKILENPTDNWEKQEMVKDIVQKKEKLDKLLQSVKEESLQKNMLNNNFTKQDSVLREKQKLMQELLNQVMDDEMKKLMNEFQKLSQEFSKDKFQQLDDKMKLEFDQMSEVLDRNIELLKNMQVEEQHDNISQQLDRLREKQDEFAKAQEDKNVSKDSLAALSEELTKEMEDIRKDYDALKKENEELTKPFDLDSFEEQFNNLSSELEKQQQNAKDGKKDKKQSDELKKEMDELAEKMKKQKEKNFPSMSLPSSDIELLAQNILLISFSQEDILKAFKDAAPQSVSYRKLTVEQEIKKRQYKIVKDSLAALAKMNMMLASLLGDKFYVIETKFNALPDYMQDSKKNELAKEQQYIINNLNDMALILMDALENSDGEGGSSGDQPLNSKSGKSKKGGKGADKNGNKPNGKDKGEQYGNLKNSQQQMKKNLENFMEQLKNGNKGMPFQQGVSNMIRQGELFRQSMEEFMMQGGGLSDTERQLMNEINKLIDDNIRDFSNYSFGKQLIDRNNMIYNKLLMSEKASKEREEYEEKRKSTTAGDTKYKRPEQLFNAKEKTTLMKSDLQRSGVMLNSYYKNLYNNYIINVGGEQ